MSPAEEKRSWKDLLEPRFSPLAFRAAIVAMLVGAFAVPLALVAIPYLEIFNDMAVQPKGKPQGLYGRARGAALVVERPAVAGTIPMGYFPYAIEGNGPESQKLAAAAMKQPLEPTLEVLRLGQEKFNSLCIACHGAGANGDGGIVGPNLFPAPPSLHTDAARGFADGKIFHIITRGQNNMPPYADKLEPRERWAVVHYVRALQRAGNPKPEDLKR